MAIGRFNLSLTGVQPGGLVYVGGTTFSGASTVSLDNVFSSTYDNYRVIINLNASGANLIRFRYRTSGSDNSNATYNFTAQQINNTSFTDLSNGTNQTSGVLFYNAGTNLSAASIDFYSPQKVTQSLHQSSGLYNQLGTFGGGTFANTTQFDGFTIYPGAGTITGTVRVYGYRNDNN